MAIRPLLMEGGETAMKAVLELVSILPVFLRVRILSNSNISFSFFLPLFFIFYSFLANLGK